MLTQMDKLNQTKLNYKGMTHYYMTHISVTITHYDSFRLRNWEKELTTAIEQQETQLRYMTENNDSLGYVTCKDIRSIFNQKMVLCIKV